MNARRRLALDGGRVPTEVHYHRVACTNARGSQKHQVCLVLGQDNRVMHLSATCTKDAAGDAVIRLGGDLCYQHVLRMRRVLQGREQYVDNVCKGIESLTNPFSRNHMAGGTGRRRNKAVAGEDTMQPQRRLALQLLNKWVPTIAGFTCAVTLTVKPEEEAGLRVVVMGRGSHSATLVAREYERGKWRTDEERIADEGMPLIYKANQTCQVCLNPNMRMTSRSAPAHFRGKEHRENCIARVRKILRFLNGLGKTP